MDFLKSYLIAFTFLIVIGSASALSEETPMTLKAGIGTDINLGVAVGVGLNIDIEFAGQEVQAGPIIYYNSWTWDGEENCCTYHEKATTTVLGVLINYTYPSNDPSLSMLFGYGAAFVFYDYLQTSPDDTSIGAFNGSNYVMEESYSGAGLVLNVGVNKKFNENLELQFEMPVIYTPASFAPTLTVSVLKRL